MKLSVPKDPIVVVDSGSGGLSVLAELVKLLPSENYLYFGDHAYIPYGSRTTAWIRRRVIAILKFFTAGNPKLVVLACNTATVAGIDRYRRSFPEIPIIGAVPVVKTAASETVTGHIAILTTGYTAASSYQKKLVTDFAGNLKTESLGSDRLVPLIESPKPSSAAISRELRRVIGHLPETNVDAVVLGCTHYPFIRREISSVLGSGIRLLDSGGAIARHAGRILENNGTLMPPGKSGKTVYFTSGDPAKAGTVGSRLTGKTVRFVRASGL